MPLDPRPITKRFAGQHCMKSTIWFPDNTSTKHAHKIGFEGALHPVIADAILAFQMHQSRVTPEMIEQLKVMALVLKKT
jgi:hypothetical protein